MIKTLLRWLGLWILAGSFVALIVDGVRWLANQSFETTLLGEFWFWLSPGGLNITQAVIERYTLPFLWSPVMITILNLPVWVVGAAIGFALFGLCRKKHSKFG